MDSIKTNLVIVLTGLALAWAVPALAAGRVWKGAANETVSGGTWTGGTPPVGGSAADQITLNPAAAATLMDDLAGTWTNRCVTTVDATFNPTLAGMGGGAALGLVGGITNVVNRTLTIDASLPVILLGDNAWNNAGTIIVACTVSNSTHLLTIDGGGTTIIRGNMSGTGAVTIESGTVNIQSSTALGSGAVTVNEAALQLQGGINAGNALTLATDSSVLQNVSGANTWSGAVTQTAFSTITNSTGALFLTGGWDNGGNALAIDGGGDTIIASVLAGGGSLTKNGTGILYLTNSAANALSGNIILNGNSVLAGDGVSGGAIVAAGNAKALGTGSISLNGGMLSLSDGLNFGNHLVVDADSSILSVNRTAGAGVTNTLGNITAVAAGTTLSIGLGDGNTTIGTSGLTIGTVTMGGNAFTIDAHTGAGAGGGALTVGGITTGGGALTITNTATVVIGATDAAAATLKKYGTGILQLSGNSSHTGATTIYGGALDLNGRTMNSSDVIISSVAGGGSGTLLAGAAGSSIKSLTMNAGTLNVATAAGAPATLTIAGDLGGADGTVSIVIRGTAAAGTDYSQIVLGGVAALSNLTLVPVAGYAPSVGDSITVVDATGGGTCATTFASVQNSSPTIKWNQSVSGNKLILTMARDLANPALDLNATQRGVANSLASAPLTGDMNKVLDAIGALTTADQVRAVYDQLTPASMAQLAVNSIHAMSVQFGNLSAHMTNLRLANSGFNGHAGGGQAEWNYDGQLVADAGESKAARKSAAGTDPAIRDTPWGFFANGQAIFGSQDDKVDVMGYNFTQAGMTMGVDYRLADEAALGLSVGYGNVATHIKQSAGNANTDSISAGPYGLCKWGDFHVNAAMAYTRNFYQTERNIHIPGMELRTAKGTPGGDQLSGFVGTGYDMRFDDFLAGPVATFQASKVWIDSYTEDGAGALNLAIDRQDVTSLQSGLGWRMQYNWRIKDITLTPSAFASWQHEFDQNKRDITSSIGGGSSFAMSTTDPQRDFANVGCGIGVQVNETISVNLSYGTQVGDSSYSEHTVNGGVRVLF
ncbi:MAG: autotransporter domain-containing protein [Verrucomicrobiae bacterium]|nr:autotransporter domain-containing protein [Verrucomicrobiae bacterium]